MAKHSKAKVKNEKVTLADGSVIDMHPRHNFDKPTRLLLQHMAAGVCSNPDCLNHTIGSNLKRNDYAGNGIAAHICAAAPGLGAARYNKDQTKEERSSYKNGIWLCGSCSIIIDRDEPRYPVDLLNEWKAKAEKRAMSMVGTKSLTQFELTDSVRAEVVRALTCNFSNMVNPFKFPVQSVHHAYKDAIEKLDPRFSVQVEISDSGVFHTITPKPGQNPKVTLVLRNEAMRDKMSERWSDLVKKGHPLEVSLNDIGFEGSPLFDAIATERGLDGRLVIKKNHPDIQTIMYLTAANGFEFEIGTSLSTVVSGSEEMTIRGSFLDGIFSFVYCSFNCRKSVKLDLSFDLLLWQDREIQNLPHYRKALKAARFIRLQTDVQICIDLIFGSNSFRIGEEHTAEYHEFLGVFHWLVGMIEKGKAIADKLNKPLVIRSLIVDEDDELRINNLYPLVSGPLSQIVAADEEIWNAFYENYESTPLDAYSGQPIQADVQIKEVQARPFNLFGNVVQSPCFETRIKGFMPVVDHSSVDDDGSVTLKIVSIEGTEMTSSLLDGSWSILE